MPPARFTCNQQHFVNQKMFRSKVVLPSREWCCEHRRANDSCSLVQSLLSRTHKKANFTLVTNRTLSFAEMCCAVTRTAIFLVCTETTSTSTVFNPLTFEHFNLSILQRTNEQTNKRTPNAATQQTPQRADNYKNDRTTERTREPNQPTNQPTKINNAINQPSLQPTNQRTIQPTNQPTTNQRCFHPTQTNTTTNPQCNQQTNNALNQQPTTMQRNATDNAFNQQCNATNEQCNATNNATQRTMLSTNNATQPTMLSTNNAFNQRTTQRNERTNFAVVVALSSSTLSHSPTHPLRRVNQRQRQRLADHFRRSQSALCL